MENFGINFLVGVNNIDLVIYFTLFLLSPSLEPYKSLELLHLFLTIPSLLFWKILLAVSILMNLQLYY